MHAAYRTMAVQSHKQKMLSPTHLIVFHVVTAGKNGEKLGSDEEEIVLISYLLYEVQNRKVVSMQCHAVCPSGAEVHDGGMTQDCKLETGLHDETLMHGKPLHCVLTDIDQFLVMKGVHPDHSGNTVMLVTDGPLHLRLGLHAESSKKKLPLHAYMYQFCDLRKEVQRYFKTGPVKSIEEMMYYLMLESIGKGANLDYGINKCQDMVAVLGCLLDAGCIFNKPDLINKGFEPAIYMNSDLIEDDCVIKARGLPWQASDHDIAKFFSGINVAKGGVAVCLSKNGRRNGEALICFENPEQRDLALRKHKHHIGQRYVELYPATGKEFIQIAGCASNRVFNFLSRRGPTNNQSIVRMRGLPFSTKPSEIREFFECGKHTTPVLDGEDGILYVYHPDGRPTGDAFVLFSTEIEASRALKKHCKESIGSRYIELYKSTPVEVTQVINKFADAENMAKDQSDKQSDSLPLKVTTNNLTQLPTNTGLMHGLMNAVPPQAPITPPFPHPSLTHPPPMPLQSLSNINNIPLQTLNTNTMQQTKNLNKNIVAKVAGRKDCLHIQNLPLEANMANILAFLDDLARKATSVHIMYDMHGMPRGEGIVQMDSAESSKAAAIQTSGKQIIFNGKNYLLEAYQISKEEMFSKAIAQMPANLQQCGGGLQTLQHQQQQQQQNYSSIGSGHMTYQTLMQPTLCVGGSNSSFQMAVPMWYPNPSTPTTTNPVTAIAIQQAQQTAILQQFQQSQHFSTRLHPSLSHLYPPAITNPTTVVVKGLPQGVSISNIRAFFKGIYENLPDIQIQTGQDGKPVGEVRVTFGSRNEAERAILECNQKMIGNRCIELHMA